MPNRFGGMYILGLDSNNLPKVSNAGIFVRMQDLAADLTFLFCYVEEGSFQLDARLSGISPWHAYCQFL